MIEKQRRYPSPAASRWRSTKSIRPESGFYYAEVEFDAEAAALA
ncbi:MAG: hypothetical protein ACLRIS_06350 [Flavonifractor plautii]